MAWIEVNPELSKVNASLERIASALELILLHAFNVRVEATAKPIADPQPENKQTVEYATDEETVKERLMEVAGMLRRGEEASEDDV